MKNRDLILANIQKNDPMIFCHDHALTKNQIPNDFESVRIGKNKVLGMPMKEWFLRPLEWGMMVIGDLPLVTQSFKNTVKWTRNFINAMDQPNSTAVVENAFALDTQDCEKNSIKIFLGMDLRLGCRGVMNESIDQQGQELIDARNNYPNRALIFWPVDPNQPDCYEKAMYALTILHFDGIKVYPSEGYLPSHPVLMKLWAYCETNKIPVVCHNSSANMHHPDWIYRIYGKIKGTILWVDTDKTVTLSTETQVADTYNTPTNWIPVLETFPNLYLDIAHFGGDWDDYLSGKPNTWQQMIIDIITNPKYPNTYTDFAYTFWNPKYAQGLKSLMTKNPAVAKKVLWGSDYSMVLIAGDYVSMKKAFYDIIGTDLMNKIAKINPKNFLNLN